MPGANRRTSPSKRIVQHSTGPGVARTRPRSKFGGKDEEVWGNLPEWIRELDVESLRKDAGIDNDAERPAAGGAGKAEPAE